MQHDDNAEADTGPIRRVPASPPAAPTDPGQRRARRARGYAETGDSPAWPGVPPPAEDTGRHSRRPSPAEPERTGSHRRGTEPTPHTGPAEDRDRPETSTEDTGAPGRTRRARPADPGTPGRTRHTGTSETPDWPEPSTEDPTPPNRTRRARPTADRRVPGSPRTTEPPAEDPGTPGRTTGTPERPEPSTRNPGAQSRTRPSAEEPGARRARTTRTPPPDTGHGHGHGPAAPASRRVKLLLAWLLGPLALITVAGAFVLYPWGQDEPTSAISSGTPVHGTIATATSGPCLAAGQVQVGEQADPDAKPCLTARITLTDGPASGRTIDLTVPVEPSTPRFSAGDDVVLAFNGGDAADPASYQLVDFQRGLPLIVLAALFAIAVLVLGRWHGLAALGALVLSFVVLVAFVLPAILAGENPLLVAIVGAGLIMFIALYLTHGVSARTSVAVLGTLVSLALIGALSAVFSAAASLTGLDDSTSTLIASLGHGIDARGLLLAGIVIGALGVLDDVTVTQTSAVWELRRANPALNWRELYSAGLRIGRDHVGSAVNTLVMAYAGAALPVMLYSSISGVGLGSILGSQDVAQEIVRTLAGSVGIVAAVPVTTVLAALIASREPISHISHSSDH